MPSRYTDRRYSEDSRRDRKKYEYSSRRTPGRSDWEDERWEWKDTPRRDGHSTPSRSHRPSPALMLVGSSPDARLVSPCLGDTPYSAGSAASPWDYVSPSLVPIRASGTSSLKYPNFRPGGRYALNLNVERAEDVLIHKRLLQHAHNPANRPAFEVRLVQASPVFDGHNTDSSLPDSPTNEDTENTNNTMRQRYMHEITFSVDDKAKPLIQAIRMGWIHPNVNLENPAEGVDTNVLVGLKKERLDIKVVLSNSFGFGGHNSSILFSPYKQ